jgi:RNA polymerase sigma-70 factor (ECF subfamily)
MIKIGPVGHLDQSAMRCPELELTDAVPPAHFGESEGEHEAEHIECAPDRLRALVEEHYAFVWRSVRRLGVAAADADDAAQQVFLVLARKLRAVRPGCEPRYLFQTALRVASDHRRAKRRRPETSDGTPTPDPVDPAAGPFDVLALRAERATLDRVLDAMPIELRAVFILHEFDEMTMAEIANVTGLRPGTVASRLRRAREIFLDKAAELTGGQSRQEWKSP